jgi:enterochelin esterase family protein
VKYILWLLAFCFVSAASGQNLAGDMALSKVLIDGEDWQMVAQGYQFTDAPCADVAGNFYFTDVSKGTNVFRISPDGKVSAFLNDAPRVSGLKFGPDGRLYACQGGLKRLIAFDVPSGKIDVLAEGVQPNDLQVTHKGDVYFTETGKKQVILVDHNRKVRVVDEGINKPNGITLSPDQGTLVVSDYGGTNLWVFRIEPDGSLAHKGPYMTVRTPLAKPDTANSDGMTTDVAGRYYVATAIGVQMFDATGRLSGVIAKPQEKNMVSVGFAGADLQYMYVTCTDKIYRRKTQTKGVLFFKPPFEAKRE